VTRRRRGKSGRNLLVHVLVLGALALLAVALVGIGRIERSRSIDATLHGIDRVRTLVGTSRPDAYRLTPTLACLLYGRTGHPFALELCYDLNGDLVEAIDRRGRESRFWDVTYEPDVARDRVAPEHLSATLREMNAFKKLNIPRGILPSGLADTGPLRRGKPYRPAS
jgi:hypothetical protein